MGKHLNQTEKENLFPRINVYESHRKKVSGKKPGKKTLVKKSQFSEVLGQNDTENKVQSLRFLGGAFFP